MDSSNTSVLAKLLIWCISFPLTFFAFTILTVFEYIIELFHMPVEVWEVINGKEIEEDVEP